MEPMEKQNNMMPGLKEFASLSRSMQQLMGLVERVVPSDVSLLLLGETGVGKEHLARAIHAAGPRSNQSFIPVNCGAIPEHLLESELFGHEVGAFTGATRRHRGMFTMAHRGTLFLDEIGEMPFHLQVKLLRALQSREIMPVGSEEVLEVDVRVMAASNRDLEQEVREGRFRRDLFYRLSVLPLTVPPLRDRVEDIPLLAGRFIRHFRSESGRRVVSMDDEALRALEAHNWPGNIRELMNVMERAVLLCQGRTITCDDLPAEISVETARNDGVPPASGGPEPVREMELPSAPGAGEIGRDPELPVADGLLDRAATEPQQPARKPSRDNALVGRPLREVRREAVEELEKRYLHALLRVTGGKVGETARRAGIVPRSLYEKMRKYGLKKEDYR
jgi:DNA-binding NtrC family response regulator